MSNNWGQNKPPQGSRINWGHPLSQGLVGCWLINEFGKYVYDVNYKNTLSGGTTAIRGINTFGTGVKSDGAVTSGYNTSQEKKFPATASPFSICFKLWTPYPDTNKGCVIFYGNNNASSRLGIKIVNEDWYGNTSIWVKKISDDSRLIHYEITKSLWSVAYTFNGTNHTLYLDGKSVGTSSTSADSTTTPTLALYKQPYEHFGYNVSKVGNVVNYVYLYNMCISKNTVLDMHISPYQFIYKPRRTFYSIPTGVTLSGTILNSTTENDIRTGGRTIVLTLTGDTWVDSGATFDGQRQNIINGLDSAQSETTGWDAEVKAKAPVTDVARTSPTEVTITLSAQSGYDITSTETITATVPATALTGGNALVATPTFDITPDATTTRGFMTCNKGWW